MFVISSATISLSVETLPPGTCMPILAARPPGRLAWWKSRRIHRVAGDRRVAHDCGRRGGADEGGTEGRTWSAETEGDRCSSYTQIFDVAPSHGREGVRRVRIGLDTDGNWFETFCLTFGLRGPLCWQRWCFTGLELPSWKRMKLYHISLDKYLLSDLFIKVHYTRFKT